MEFQVLSPVQLSPERLARWAQLQGADVALDSPFLSPHWVRAVDRAQDDDARNVKVAIGIEGGRDVAFFPARVNSITAMPAGAPMSDYQGVVAEPGVEIDPRQLVRALGVDRYDFAHMLESQQAFAPHARGRMISHRVKLEAGYDAYQAERRAAGTSFLKDCDKKRRKAGREAGEPVFTAFSRSRADFDQLVEWKREQLRATSQTDIFAWDWTLRLMRELFTSRDPDFGGVLYTLHFGDKLAAAHFHLRGRRTIHGWIIAHDPAFERYSPGLMLFQDILRWMDGTPYDRLDLGPGDYRFKHELANDGLWVTYGFVGRPSPAALARSAAYGVRAAVEALPLGRVSGLPGKAMRRVDQRRGLR